VKRQTTPVPLLLAPYAALAAAGVAVYANTLGNPFVFDDGLAITNNPHLRSLWPLWEALGAPPGSAASGRPLAALSLALNYALGGLVPRGYHLFNIGVHVAAAGALFAAIGVLLRTPRLAARHQARARPVAFAAALIWLVHPLHTAALDHVCYRNEVLIGCFFFLAIAAFGRALESARLGSAAAPRWTALTVAACLLGVASKEVMAAAPVVLLAYDALFEAGSVREALRRRGRTYAGCAVSWLFLVVLLVTGDRGAAVTAQSRFCTPLDYARSQFGVVLHYLRLAVWPRPLVLDADWPVAKSWAPVLPALLAIAALWAATAWAWRRRSAWAFAGVLFFAALAPTSSVVPITGVLMAEHRMYVPLAALVTAAVVALSGIPGRMVRAGLCGLVVVALGTVTVRRNADYATALRIWTDTVQKAPHNPRAHTNLGNAQLAAGDIKSALASFRTAAQLDPLDAAVQVNLAGGLIRQNRLDEAATAVETALRIRPNDAGALYNQGLLHLRHDDAAAAAAAFRRAAAADPQLVEAHYNLGVALVQQRAWRDAIEAFRHAVQEEPRHAGALNNAAWLFATCPDAAVRSASEALEWAQRAIATPAGEDPEFLDTLAAAYAEAGRFPEAIETAHRASDLAARRGRPDLASRIDARSALYATARPYRMP